jgi:hypothetical protein
LLVVAVQQFQEILEVVVLVVIAALFLENHLEVEQVRSQQFC